MLPFIQYQTTSLHSPLNSSQCKDFLHFLQYKDLIKIPCNVVTVYRNQNCETELKYLEPRKINSTAPGPFIPGQYGLTQFISDWGLNLLLNKLADFSPPPRPPSLSISCTQTLQDKKNMYFSCPQCSEQWSCWADCQGSWTFQMTNSAVIKYTAFSL